MKSNFDFLNRYWPALAQIGATAETYVYSDPNACAKEQLKIYWSSETMQEVVAGFSIDTSRKKSLAIIKEKLKQDKNT